MAFRSFEDHRVFQMAEKLADEIWDIVSGWEYFAKDPVGKQLVKSADSIGANIAEGSGRGTAKDNRRFLESPVARIMKLNTGCEEPVAEISLMGPNH